MLHDVVSGAGLVLFAEAAMVLFIGVFLVAAVRVFTTRRENLEALARIPFNDEKER